MAQLISGAPRADEIPRRLDLGCGRKHCRANSSTEPTHGLRFEDGGRVLAFHNGMADRLVAGFANGNPRLYEQRFAWIYPAWFLLFKLRAL